jgi:hypothetical protein
MQVQFEGIFLKRCSCICPRVFKAPKDLRMRLHSTDVKQANDKSLRDDLQEALESTNVAADEAHFLEKRRRGALPQQSEIPRAFG